MKSGSSEPLGAFRKWLLKQRPHPRVVFMHNSDVKAIFDVESLSLTTAFIDGVSIVGVKEKLPSRFQVAPADFWDILQRATRIVNGLRILESLGNLARQELIKNGVFKQP